MPDNLPDFMWVNVEDALPEHLEHVLAVMQDNRIEIVHFYKDYFKDVKESGPNGEHAFFTAELVTRPVKYWSPLPDSPPEDPDA